MPRSNPWFVAPKPVKDPSVRLFCIHHAGGSATVYHSWASRLPGTVEMLAVQLPGRTYRLHEAPFTSMEPLVNGLCRAMAPHLDRPFALFGHSMGALIAFETVRALRADGMAEPAHLIVSAHRAPHLPNRLPELRRLPDAEFRKALHEIFGTPPNLLEDDHLMRISSPALRADFTIIETWKWKDQSPLSVPITAMGGCSDPTLRHSDLEAWRFTTSAAFESRWFPGGHFYLTANQALATRAVADVVAGCL